jgi:hypothetical protein
MPLKEIDKKIIANGELIEEISQSAGVKISLGKKYFKAVFQRIKPKGVQLEFKCWDSEINEKLKLSFSIRGRHFVARSYYRKHTSFSTKTGFKHTIYIYEFSEVQRGRKYHRMMIPLKKKYYWHHVLSDSLRSYSADDNYIRRSLLTVTVGKNSFHIYTWENKDEKAHFLCIDGVNKATRNIFENICWSILVTVGYMTGNLIQDEAFVFSYDDKNMEDKFFSAYTVKRDSIKAIYKPIDSNPYGWETINQKMGDFYYSRLIQMNSAQLSALCELVHHDKDIKAIILLIQESMSRSLMIMPAGLSIAIEGLASYFQKYFDSASIPMVERSLSRQIKKRLKETLKEFKTEELSGCYNVLENRINELTSPTNRDKLKAPFSILKIPLTALDEEVLMYRNDFLHGNINLTPSSDKRKGYSMDSFEISMRLYTLINMIIVRLVGFEGYVLNHVRLQQKGIGKKINEEPFRSVVEIPAKK